ncbi:hypothetical protein [Allonocardiopsis opalescens]|nr:hypothetical protein [Allonocardiopsis opalescens]
MPAASGSRSTPTTLDNSIHRADGELPVNAYADPVFRHRRRVDDGMFDVRWIGPGELADLPVHHTQRLRLHHAAISGDGPYLG